MDERLKRTEEMIRKGQIAPARRLLRTLKPSKLERADASVFADLALRTDLPLLALQSLNPILRPQMNSQVEPSVQERILYASGLRTIGALYEADEILAPIDANETPDVELQRAFNHIRKWDYEKAISPLKRFIAHPKTADYRKWVGRLNLAASLVALAKIDEATETLAQLRKHTQDLGHNLLYGHSLEISAQVALVQSDWASAKNHLDQADRVFTEMSSENNRFLIRKWRALLQLMTSNTAESASTVTAIRAEAERLNNWESLRDCDLFLGHFGDRRDLVQRVLAGTPYPSYRKRMQRFFGISPIPPEEFAWTPGQTDAPLTSDVPVVVDLSEATGKASAFLMAHPLLLRVLQCLCLDFYRPLSHGLLHHHVFPGEYFNPHSSPQRIATALSRLVHGFRAHGLHLEIKAGKTETRILQLTEGAIRVAPSRAFEAPDEIRLHQWKLRFRNQEFQKKDLETLWPHGQRSLQHLLRRALESGKITKQGRGRNVRYRVR
ncbi:MAG: hypothetical protein NDI61_06470 [Bdellovibrionaceae bacterium]|nr:hypothetical protein [Pseudobdellovibrionaceae bacterium]